MARQQRKDMRGKAAAKAPAVPKTSTAGSGKVKTDRGRWLLRISPFAVLLIAVWTWAAWWYGPVLRIAREYSFWAPDSTLMYYESGRPWGELWKIGLMLLQTFRWPVAGGLLTALLLAVGTHLLGYCLRLKGWWRLLQYVPAIVFTCWIAFIGFDLYFEHEAGRFMGVPALCVLVLIILAAIIRSFSRNAFPWPWKCQQTKVKAHACELLAAVLPAVLAIGLTAWKRPDVRVTTQMQCLMMKQDWRGMQEVAREHAELSYRPMAAYYAIATVMRGEQGSRMFDIRMDYDDPYMHGMNGNTQSHTNYYMMDCDYYAGLVQSAIHHGMEQMTMNGPSIRTLKLLAKCALLTGEDEVARKYLRILDQVPFEGDWVERYSAMMGDSLAIESDGEFKMVRLTEPVHDSFENSYVQPVFLGYNAQLKEGRSINALWNSLTVHIYTKTMPQFVERLNPLVGTALPESYAQAVQVLSTKQPQLLQMFPDVKRQQMRMAAFVQEARPLMSDRAKYARELFPKYKGYYPYYYFFGNLKATRKKTEETNTSSSGVN